jgi:O-antigen/teichoic acid export membrane protein
MNFLYEILAVGVATAIIGFVISTLLMYVFVKDFSTKKYHFWWQVILSYFITGCLVHVLCQITGINKWYCKNGVACKFN